MEKWQGRLIIGKGTDEVRQSETSVPVGAPEGEQAVFAHIDETPQLSKDATIACLPGHDNNRDGVIIYPHQGGRTTAWGIPIADGWDTDDPVFQRHPLECDCFRAGVLRCGVPCIWAWPPGAKPGDKAQRIIEV